MKEIQQTFQYSNDTNDTELLKKCNVGSTNPPRKIINNGNRTEWSPILSVTIQVIIKKDPEFSSLTIQSLYLQHERTYM